MCGIAGYFSFDKRPVDAVRFKNALRSIAHRGPDDHGCVALNTKSDGALFVGDADLPGINTDLLLGHRRLSIIDLSPSARQPMTDDGGHFWVVYNGEIYNYVELREELKALGHIFRTNSDTEVIIKAYAQWGVECLERFNGMFAFALWDVKQGRLFCARDRAGVKPFYYYCDGNRFVFASEIKALLELDIARGVNNQIVYEYLSEGLTDHTDETFFSGIRQLRPAHYLIVSRGNVEITRWWDIDNREMEGLTDKEYSRRFYELLEDSIRLRLRSDVPVGTCLSGGLDSSSIVCLANDLMFHGGYPAAVVGDRQMTFSACSEDRQYDERIFLKAVTEKTNAKSHCVFPDGEKLFESIPEVIWHQDEPFSSTSIFAQWQVMKLARDSGVKVVLDGQGADELLAGYHCYFGTYFIDLAIRFRLFRLLREIYCYRLVHKSFKPEILASAARYLLPESIIHLLRGMFKGYNAGQVDIGNRWIDGAFQKEYKREYPKIKKFNSSLKNQLYTLFVSSRLPALLHYEDRNSMAFSMEARVPFLDYRLIEYAFSLPVGQKLRGGTTKVVLREAMQGILPEKVRTRVDKMGFVTPENVWFRTILKDRITELIESREFSEMGYFNVHAVRQEFRRHCMGEKDIGFTIWRWVNLLLWREMFFNRAQ